MSDPLPGTLVVPTELVWRGDDPVLTFGEVPLQRLALPFWHRTIEAARVVAIAPLDSLGAPAVQARIAGGVFHMTRCGSTLVARQFSALPRTYAISEPFAVQHLLVRSDDDLERRARRLRTLLAAYAGALSPVADTVVIKWSSLSGLYAAEIERALPAMPSIFLHRRADEVLASIAAAPLGGQRHVAPEQFGRHRPMDPAACSRLEVSARVIANICDQLAGAASPRSVDYADLPEATSAAIAPFFGFRLGGVERAAMARAAEPHAKDATRAGRFAGDAWRDVELQDPQVRDLAATLVGPSLAACLARLPMLTPPALAKYCKSET